MASFSAGLQMRDTSRSAHHKWELRLGERPGGIAGAHEEGAVNPLVQSIIAGAILGLAACGGDNTSARAEAAGTIPPDGCYSLTPLPDSIYSLASDLDWPTELRWRDGRGDGSSHSFSAEALDPDWNSLASPIGSGRLVAPDSIILNWGVTSLRLRVTGSGTLLGRGHNRKGPSGGRARRGRWHRYRKYGAMQPLVGEKRA